jgi:hypothetical protein
MRGLARPLVEAGWRAWAELERQQMRHLATRQAIASVIFAGLLSACGSAGATGVKPAANTTGTMSSSGECSALTAADISTVTGDSVTAVARGSFPGAGGTCGNYTSADGKPYLGINVSKSTGAYQMALSAVPKEIYPVSEKLQGVGDEAVLLKDSAQNTHMRYLVAHKGDAAVVLFPLTGQDNLSDDELKQLASRALGA